MFPIEKVKTHENHIFLTFDDGPDEEVTPLVLDLLEKHQAFATFYVIGNRAIGNKDIVQRIIQEGHGLGDHSIDHQYRHFFKGIKGTTDWVKESHELLKKTFGVEIMGFRSPAGVRTPPLGWSLKNLNIPWVHWSHRFYDTQFLFTEKRFSKKINKIAAGDIILLHDSQKLIWKKDFLRNLDLFIGQLKDKGFDFKALTSEKLMNGN